RHIGYLRDLRGDVWYARIWTRAESYYRRRLGWARSEARPDGLDYEEALAAAHAWFSSSGMSSRMKALVERLSEELSTKYVQYLETFLADLWSNTAPFMPLPGCC